MNSHYQLTLDNVLSKRRLTDNGWQDWPGELTQGQSAGIFSMLSKGCRPDTKNRLRACLADNCRRVKPEGILRRVHLYEGQDDTASYCAGQDYGAEIALVRKILIASY